MRFSLPLLCVVAATRAFGVAQTNEPGALAAAQQHFYSARFQEAAAAALPLTKSGSVRLAACEVRTSALHFQIKRLLNDGTSSGKSFKQCKECPALLDAFMKDLTSCKTLARAQLKTSPQSVMDLFYLGKLDSNYVWLQLSTLGKRTGWSEYWNARHSMDAVLKMNPSNIRARVARAWIDYIVDTRVPFGMQWVLGGGDKKRGLKTVMDASAQPVADRFVHAEAGFALWEMLVQEKRRPEALEVAKRLLADFPENQDLLRFVKG